MKSATSLLLGAALATAFFLLYTSVCRDLGDGPARSPPPRWTREQDKEEESVRAAADDHEGRRPKHEVVAEREQDEEEERKVVVTSNDGDGGATPEQHNKQQIAMPGSQQRLESSVPQYRILEARGISPYGKKDFRSSEH